MNIHSGLRDSGFRGLLRIKSTDMYLCLCASVMIVVCLTHWICMLFAFGIMSMGRGGFGCRQFK